MSAPYKNDAMVKWLSTYFPRRHEWLHTNVNSVLAEDVSIGDTDLLINAIPLWARVNGGYARIDTGTTEAEMRRVTASDINGLVVTMGAMDYAHAADDVIDWDKLPILRAYDFGASTGGSAGSNYTAIQRMLDHVTKVGPCTILIPEQYQINDKLYGTDLYNCRLTGNASGSHYGKAYGGLTMASTVEKTILVINQTAGTELGLKIDGLYLFGNRFSADHTYADILAAMAAEEGHGIQLDRVLRVEVASVAFWGMVGHGLTGVGSSGTINLLNAHDNYFQDCGRRGFDGTNIADSWIHHNEVGTSGKGIHKASLGEHDDAGVLHHVYPTDASLEVSQGIFIGNDCNEVFANRVYQTVGHNIYIYGDRNHVHHNLEDGATRTGIFMIACQDNLVAANINYDNGVVYTPIGWSHELDAGRNAFDEAGCAIYLANTAIKNKVTHNDNFVSVKSFGREGFRGGQINGILCRGHLNTLEANTCEGNSNDGIQVRGSGNEALRNICRFNAQRGININGTDVAATATLQPNEVAWNVCRANNRGIMVTQLGSAHIHDNDTAEIYGNLATETLAALHPALGGDTTIELTNPTVFKKYDVVLIQCDATADRPIIWQANTVISVVGNVLTLAKPIIGLADSTIASAGNEVRTRRQAYGVHLIGGASPACAGNVVLGRNIYGDALIANLQIDGGTVTYNQYNSGTATVPNGSTFIDITHSMSRTPSINDIGVTATNNLGNAVMFWISNVTSTQFRINVDIDPGATTATFVWAIDMKS